MTAINFGIIVNFVFTQRIRIYSNQIKIYSRNSIESDEQRECGSVLLHLLLYLRNRTLRLFRWNDWFWKIHESRILDWIHFRVFDTHFGIFRVIAVWCFSRWNDYFCVFVVSSAQLERILIRLFFRFGEIFISNFDSCSYSCNWEHESIPILRPDG